MALAGINPPASVPTLTHLPDPNQGQGFECKLSPLPPLVIEEGRLMAPSPARPAAASIVLWCSRRLNTLMRLVRRET